MNQYIKEARESRERSYKMFENFKGIQVDVKTTPTMVHSQENKKTMDAYQDKNVSKINYAKASKESGIEIGQKGKSKDRDLSDNL